MKSISLYVDKDTYLTRMHPFTKLCYIFTAIVASLVAGKLWAFAAFIGLSLNADQWKNHSQGFSTDCVFIYNSDYHIFDPRII